MARNTLEDFIIDMDDLELESIPFAVGGSGQIFRGSYNSADVAVKVRYHATRGGGGTGAGVKTRLPCDARPCFHT
jgi:hypothetical protein